MDRFYLTTAIDYVNSKPHLGTAYEKITADVIARYKRGRGVSTRFLMGNDEHSANVRRRAAELDLDPLAYCDQMEGVFREVWSRLDISFDDFIRTTEPRHHRSVQALMQRAYDNGYIYRAVYDGWYSVSDEAYVPEDDVSQEDIESGRVERMTEENYFFKLSEFEAPLLEWFEANPANITPEGYRNEALGIIRGGLRDISITRTSIDWGVPVPWAEGHVFYVWYDALTNYATAAGYGHDDERFAAWWPSVRHLIGKDIIRFHCVYWPAMLLAAGVEELPRYHVHGWLLVGGEKMSKSAFNQIAPADLVGDFGVDGFRYSLLRDTPFGPDSEVSHEALQHRYNTDLANNFGNLLQRSSTLVGQKCGGVGPAPDPDHPLADVAAEVYADAAAAWDRFQPSVALEATWRLIRDTNEYLQATEPWKMEPGPLVSTVLGNALEALRIVCVLASPAIPSSCEAAWARLGLDGSPLAQRLPEAAAWGQYPGGLTVAGGAPLFPRIKG